MDFLLKNNISVDWVALVCLFALAVLVLAKNISTYHFKNFILLLVTDKYVKIHKGDSLKNSIHNVLSFFQVLILPLFLQLLLFKFNKIDELNFIFYLKIVGAYFLFLSGRFFLEKILIALFRSKKQFENYFFEIQTYKNYFSVLFFPAVLLLAYNSFYSNFIEVTILTSAVLLILLIFLLVINHYRKLFYKEPLCFILYLCIFQVTPYILVYKLALLSYLI